MAAVAVIPVSPLIYASHIIYIYISINIQICSGCGMCRGGHQNTTATLEHQSNSGCKRWFSTHFSGAADLCKAGVITAGSV